MATPFSILGANTLPDTTGEVIFNSYAAYSTVDQWQPFVFVFNESTQRAGLYGTFRVPAQYGSTSSTKADILVEWTNASASTKEVEWDFDYRAVGGDDTESLNQSGTQESVNINDKGPSAAHERMVATLNLTEGNLAPNDRVEFALFRDCLDAGDTSTLPAIVFDVLFDYST